MILNYPLSDENLNLLNLGPKEEIYYCLPFDIGKEGEICNNSYFVMTNERILRLEEGVLTGDYRIEDYDKIKSEPQISSGILVLWKGETPILLGRFSAKHLVRFSYMKHAMEILKSGRTEKVVSTEYETTCPKCGRGMHGVSKCPHCEGTKKGIIHTLFQLSKGHLEMLFCIFLLMGMATAITLLNPIVQKHLIDDVILSASFERKKMVLWFAAFLLLTVGIELVNACKSFTCSKLGSYINANLREKMFQKLQSLSLSYILETSPGTLMNRVMGDTQKIGFFFESVFCNLFTIVILFVCVCVYMLILNWRMALLAFIFAPFAMILSGLFRTNIRKRFRMQGIKGDQLNSRLQDVLSGMSVVKSYGQEQKEAKRFEDAVEDYARVQRGNESFFAVFFPCLSFVLGIGIYFVTYAGGRRVLLGDMTCGELVQFINYASLMYQYVDWMSNMPKAVMNLVTSMERIEDILEQEPTIYDHESAVSHEIKGDITFEHASFGYKSFEPVLEDINLTVKQGEMIGLVGASGTGKSTLINLLMHLYEVDDGRILVDGVDIKDIKLSDYHKQLGVVLQENILFAGTVFQNIAYAKPDATIEEVIAVAKMANAHEFITKLPDGYQTYVGEFGGNLSGGEKQRIAIARAMLGNPRLLILDEATASLDTESEYLIQKALGRLTNGRTTFAIAHRLSTLKDADRLVVIDGHSIAEIGSHEELMEKKGIYYNLVKAQMKSSHLA